VAGEAPIQIEIGARRRAIHARVREGARLQCSVRINRDAAQKRLQYWNALFRGERVDPAEIDRELPACAKGLPKTERRALRILRGCAVLAGRRPALRDVVRAAVAYWFSNLGIDGLAPRSSDAGPPDLADIIGAQLSWDAAVKLTAGGRSIDSAAYRRFLELLEAEVTHESAIEEEADRTSRPGRRAHSPE